MSSPSLSYGSSLDRLICIRTSIALGSENVLDKITANNLNCSLIFRIDVVILLRVFLFLIERDFSSTVSNDFKVKV